MSKWVNKEKFEDFKKEREQDKSDDKGGVDYARLYPNPKMGTLNNPKEYHVRLTPDPNGDFYKKYHYHMFQSGESWVFIMCPKTYDMNAYCPWCHANQILYKGSASDKKKAYQYKRKEKYVGNIYVVRDPRDADENDPDKKLTGKTFLYNFPQTIETLIRKEITDIENGWGYDIFDPENGYNLIISIGAKKPDKSGKVWPDYSLTAFAKRPSAIADTEEGIDTIMETTQDITEYINNSMFDAETHKKLLKAEMLYDDVEELFIRNFGEDKNNNNQTNSKPEESNNTKNNDKFNESTGDDVPINVESEGSVDDPSNSSMSDEDILNELDNM